jgi:hypothetical protein
MKVRTPIDLKLKPGWRFESRRGVFVAASRVFEPDLPARSRIVFMVPRLSKAEPATLSKAERDLQRRLQVILPGRKRPEDYVDAVRAWPCVAEAHVAPRVSLP